MEKEMAVLEWLYCRRCHRKFIDDNEGCPSCLDYAYCSTVKAKVFYFAAKTFSKYTSEVIKMELETRTLAKNCHFINGWERIALTQEEREAIDDAVRKKNIEVLKESIVDASEIFPFGMLPDTARWQFAVALFEARRPHIYTVLKEALDTKIATLRENGNSNGKAQPFHPTG